MPRALALLCLLAFAQLPAMAASSTKPAWTPEAQEAVKGEIKMGGLSPV